MAFGAFHSSAGHWFSSSPSCKKLLPLDGLWEIGSWLSVDFLKVFSVIGLLSWKITEGWERQQVQNYFEARRGFWDEKGDKCWAGTGRKGHSVEGEECFIPLVPESVRLQGS